MKSFMHLWEIYVTTIDLVLREIGGGYAELLLATVEEGVCHAIRRYTLIALGKSPKVERECKPESNLGVSLDYCSVPESLPSTKLLFIPLLGLSRPYEHMITFAQAAAKAPLILKISRLELDLRKLSTCLANERNSADTLRRKSVEAGVQHDNTVEMWRKRFRDVREQRDDAAKKLEEEHARLATLERQVVEAKNSEESLRLQLLALTRSAKLSESRNATSLLIARSLFSTSRSFTTTLLSKLQARQATLDVVCLRMINEAEKVQQLLAEREMATEVGQKCERMQEELRLVVEERDKLKRECLVMKGSLWEMRRKVEDMNKAMEERKNLIVNNSVGQTVVSTPPLQPPATLSVSAPAKSDGLWRSQNCFSPVNLTLNNESGLTSTTDSKMKGKPAPRTRKVLGEIQPNCASNLQKARL